MSNISLLPATAFSLVAAYGLVRTSPEALFSSPPSFFLTLVVTWVLSFVLYCLWNIILYPKYFSPLRHLPTVPGGSFWNGHEELLESRGKGTVQAEWINTIPNDGFIRYFGPLNIEKLMPTKPQVLSEILVTKSYIFAKPAHIIDLLSKVLGMGILFSEGEEHRIQRKNLMPAFAFRHIKNLYPTFWQKSRETVLAIDKSLDHSSEDSDSNVIEVLGWANRATLDIIGVAGMGQDFGAINDPNSPLAVTYRQLSAAPPLLDMAGVLGLIVPAWVFSALPIKRHEVANNAGAAIRETCRQLIRTKKEKLENDELNDTDILSVALGSGGFTEEELVDQLMTFLAAGHETTASALTWAIYFVSKYPEIQSRLREEIHANLSPITTSDMNITNEEIDHLPYLHAVCNEVLRFFAPVPSVSRQTIQETTVSGVYIPSGTQVAIVPAAINVSKELWGPDGNVFDPARWLANDESPHSASGGATSNYSFTSFLHGPRSCIGASFARAEFACMLAGLVGHFEFELDPRSANLNIDDMTSPKRITRRPNDGLFVKTKVIDGW